MVTTRALWKLAASGDADAQFRLGYRFAFCKDKRRRNLKRAFSMWKAAAEQGHLRARFYLGTCYDFGSGTRRSLARLRLRPCGSASLAAHFLITPR